MTDCLFCKMVSGVIAPDTVFEDDQVLAFRDLNPQAPLHVLVIPKQHISTLNDLNDIHEQLVCRLLTAAAKIAMQEGYADSGYRTIVNCNADGGQTVFHIHLHLLAGRIMHWPPG